MARTSTRVRVKWRRAGFAEIRTSAAIEARLGQEVDRIMSDAEGREGDYQGGVDHGTVRGGRGRSRGYVVTRGMPAIRREAKDHTLLRALGGR